MPKVEVDLPELPHGYVYTGEFRKLLRGDEHVIFHVGLDAPDLGISPVQTWKSHLPSTSVYPIVKKLWQPPVGIFNPGWLAVDEDGTVGWYAEQPTFWPDDGHWEVNSDAKNKSVALLRLPSNGLSTGLREEFLPPASMRGPKAIWQVG
jgi:hypothetical protein